jgi:hypothetical protein
MNGMTPSAGQNLYLYSGFAAPGSIEFVTTPRWLIVFGASATILMFALAGIYVPAARRGWIAVAALCLLAGLAIAFPAPAVLLGQASILGIAMAVIAIWISRWTARSPQSMLVAASGSTQRPVARRPESTPATVKSVVTTGASSVTVIRAGDAER